jgi:hypothetical protein
MPIKCNHADDYELPMWFPYSVSFLPACISLTHVCHCSIRLRILWGGGAGHLHGNRCGIVALWVFDFCRVRFGWSGLQRAEGHLGGIFSLLHSRNVRIRVSVRQKNESVVYLVATGL